MKVKSTSLASLTYCWWGVLLVLYRDSAVVQESFQLLCHKDMAQPILALNPEDTYRTQPNPTNPPSSCKIIGHTLNYDEGDYALGPSFGLFH